MKCTSQGDGKGRGISRLAEKPGLFRELIVSHMGYDPGLRKIVQEEKAACYMLPLGNLMKLFQAIAGGLPGAIATTGLGTFADPRNGGGKINQKAKDAGREVVSLVELGGKECLFYPAFPIDVCFIRATYGDEAGNLSIRDEAMNIEQFEVAAAVHNSGGIVIAQVDKIVKAGTIPPKEVLIHGFMVDYVVEGRPEYSRQSFATDAFRPEIAGLAQVPVEEVPPLSMGPRKICCRRAVMELRPDSLINLGIGMPGGIGAVAQEEGLADLFTVSVECGPIGGVPLGGIDFGAAVNPEAIYRMSDTLQLYDGGALDMAVLGFAEVDRYGNVNASSFHGRMVGPGGFIDITQNARKLCFIGTFTAGKQDVGLRDNGLVIRTQGPQKKFLAEVESITFSGREAVRKGQEVLYITERAEGGHHPGGDRPRGGPAAGHSGPDGLPAGDPRVHPLHGSPPLPPRPHGPHPGADGDGGPGIRVLAGPAPSQRGRRGEPWLNPAPPRCPCSRTSPPASTRWPMPPGRPGRAAPASSSGAGRSWSGRRRAS